MVADFNKKGNREFFNEKLLFKTVGIMFVLIIFALLFADFKIYQKKKELVAQIASYQKKIDDIKKSSQNLKNEIANSDNPDYLEKIAYEQLGEQKPGEQEFIFINPQEKLKPAAKPENFWDLSSWLVRLSGSWQWIKAKF